MEEHEVAAGSTEAWKVARSSCIHALLAALVVLSTLSTTWDESTVLNVGAVVFVLVGLMAAGVYAALAMRLRSDASQTVAAVPQMSGYRRITVLLASIAAFALLFAGSRLAGVDFETTMGIVLLMGAAWQPIEVRRVMRSLASQAERARLQA